MGYSPQFVVFDETESEQAPLPASQTDVESIEKPAVKTPAAMTFDASDYNSPHEMPEPPSEDNQCTTIDAITPDNTRSIPDTASENSPVTKHIAPEFEQSDLILSIDKKLEDFAETESQLNCREPVFIHYMLGNTVIGEYSGFVGDKLDLPSITEIAESMVDSWDPAIFVGWNSDGIAHNSSDISAILRSTYLVQIMLNDHKLGDIVAVEGTKVSKLLEQHFDELGLKTPLFVNYSIYCNSKIITSDNTVRLQSKFTEPQRQQFASEADKQIVVIFAIRPSDIGYDISTMSKEELRKVTVIQQIVVNAGDSIVPPNDEILKKHGIPIPFDKHFRWINFKETVTENTVIRAEPLKTEKVSDDMPEQSNEITFDNIKHIGKSVLRHTFTMLSHPAIMYAEHKLLKEFERGRTVRSRDFTFLRWKGELMLCKYTGVGPIAEIPAIVNGMYVKYIHPRALTSGEFKFNGLFGMGRQSVFDRISTSSSGIAEVILPRTIKYLPGNFLYGVPNVTTLVVPETVSEISPVAFDGSALSEIYFNGACPRGFDRRNVSAEIFVQRKAYKSFYL